MPRSTNGGITVHIGDSNSTLIQCNFVYNEMSSLSTSIQYKNTETQIVEITNFHNKSEVRYI